MDDSLLKQLMDDSSDDIPVSDSDGQARVLRNGDFLEPASEEMAEQIEQEPEAPAEEPSVDDVPSRLAEETGRPVAVAAPSLSVSSVPVAEDEEAAEEAPLPAVPPAPKPQPEPAAADLMLADEPTDAREIEAIKEEMGQRSGSGTSLADQRDFLEKQIDAAIEESGFKSKSEDIRQRFRTVVGLYFRDLRDSLETRQKLQQPLGSGGLGLSGEQADKIMSVLEEKVGVYRSVMAEQSIAEKKEFVAEKQKKIMKAESEQARAEADARDELYSRVTGKTAVSSGNDSRPPVLAEHALPKPKPVHPPEPKMIPVTAVSDKKGEAGPKPSEPKPSPSISVSVSEPAKPAPPVTSLKSEAEDKVTTKAALPLNLPSIDEMDDGAGMLPDPANCKGPKEEVKATTETDDLDILNETGKPKPVAQEKPAAEVKPAPPKPPPPMPPPLKPEPKPGPTPPPQPPKPAPKPAAEPVKIPTRPAPAKPEPDPEKKVVSDVKFTPKLTGPVEELKSMRLSDFRRLSKDPKEATLKISDKIDLLQDQEFEMKTAGIKAWQDSEVNRMYLELLRQGLEGRPVVDVIKEKENKGEPVLSKAEFDAIMELNRKLRFG